MAFGANKGTLTASVNSVTNPTVLSGSVAVVVGDLVFGTFSQQTNLTATTTISDNLGNTWAYVNTGTDAGTVSIRCFYSRITVAGTLTTINVPAAASTNDASAVATVVEGPFITSPLDANPANTTDATTPFDCPVSGTLAQAGEVVMAGISIAGNQTVAATSPATLAGTVARANASTGNSITIVTTTASVTPRFTGTSATSGQTTASFRRQWQGEISAIGAGTATAAGASRVAVAASSAGASTGTMQGAAVASAALSAAGTSTATAVGEEAAGVTYATTDLSAAGTGTATAAGGAIAQADLSAAGTFTGVLGGAGIAQASLSAAGAAVATADGAARAQAALSAQGAAVASGDGAAIGAADLSAVGQAVATAVGADATGATYATADMSAAGSSTAIAEGAATTAAALEAAGASTATLEGLAVGGTPAEEEEPAEQPVTEGPGGGMWTRNPWAERRRKKRDEIEREELDLLLLGQIAAQQLARDHMNRVRHG